MNDTMSLLLAAGILSVGGLGLFMYKNSSDDKDYEKEGESLFDFDLRSYFGNSSEENNEEYNEEEPEPEVYEQPKRSRGSKTKSSRKNTGTKRRY